METNPRQALLRERYGSVMAAAIFSAEQAAGVMYDEEGFVLEPEDFKANPTVSYADRAAKLLSEIGVEEWGAWEQAVKELLEDLQQEDF